MANDSETVREVCAEMSYDIVHDAEWFVDRILSAHEREIAAKDAEIALLKEKSCEYALPNHGCTAEDKHFHKTVELERKVALLERALKPVMDVNLDGMDSYIRVNCESILKSIIIEAQRIYKEGCAE